MSQPQPTPSAVPLRRLEQRTAPIAGRVNPRRMSPRQLADWAAELHADGMLTRAEFAVAGFPAELHPDYDRIVGTLTGERGEPDRPRDMIALWEDRHRREVRCLGPAAARSSGRIVELLRWQASGLAAAA